MKSTKPPSSVAMLFLILCSPLALAQQTSSVSREGDVFRGPVKTVRSERASLRSEGDQLIEGPLTLIQTISYSSDSLSRETYSYYPDGSHRAKTVETYHPNGTRASLTSYDRQGKITGRTSYEYDGSGALESETRYNPDGSILERRIIQRGASSPNLVAVTKTSGAGTNIESAVNTRDDANKTSKWRYSKPDGTRSEDTFSRDEAGNRITEQLFYGADGSLTGRRVSKVDAATTRLEATVYEANGSVRTKTLETREYDSRRNLTKIVNYQWVEALQKFEPTVVSYHRITYF